MADRRARSSRTPSRTRPEEAASAARSDLAVDCDPLPVPPTGSTATCRGDVHWALPRKPSVTLPANSGADRAVDTCPDFYIGDIIFP